jgi:hypothetical protein
MRRGEEGVTQCSWSRWRRAEITKSSGEKGSCDPSGRATSHELGENMASWEACAQDVRQNNQQKLCLETITDPKISRVSTLNRGE